MNAASMSRASLPPTNGGMEIIHVIPTLAATYGGPALAVVEMATWLAGRGHRLAILATDHGGSSVDLSAARDASVDIEICARRFPRTLFRSPDLRAALARRARSADLIVVHSPYLDHTRLVYQIAKRSNVPYIFRPHGAFDPYLREQRVWRKRIAGWLYHDAFLRRAGGIHFTAADERTLARSYIFDRPAFVVPLGLDLAKLGTPHASGILRRRWPQLGDEPIILFLGRITEKKGLDILAPAFGAARHALGCGHLVLAGPEDPEMRKPVRRWLADAGVLDHTIFTGMLRGEEKLAALHEADVFVLPSYTENFGIAILEALATGTPVVISDKVNIWREIDAAGVGLVTPLQPNAVAEAILTLLCDPDRRASMSTRARPFVEMTYAWSSIVPRLESAYHKVIEAHRAGREAQFVDDYLRSSAVCKAT